MAVLTATKQDTHTHHFGTSSGDSPATGTARVDVRTFDLEMRSPSELRPARSAAPPLAVRRLNPPGSQQARFVRSLYGAVGARWHWTDRAAWTDRQWHERLSRNEVEVWVAYVGGEAAGYYELERQPCRANGGTPDLGARMQVEICHLGLLPSYIGRGLGGGLLTDALRRAWDSGACRVWLRTSSLDSPVALKNYEARGLRVYREFTIQKELASPTTRAPL